MKKYQYYFIVFLCLFFFTACKKSFLEVPDKTAIVRQTYVKDLQTTSEFLNGIYVSLASKFYYGATVIYPDVIADNIKATSFALTAPYAWAQVNDNEDVALFHYFSQNCNGLWYSGYKIARDCSFVIETVDNYRSENAATADQIKGQAYAIRALVHSVLVNVFAQAYNFTPDATHAGIPYVATPDYSKPVSRATVKEVYAAIIADLEAALPLLAEGPNDNRLMNQGAVKALLARIQLSAGNFQMAREYAVAVAAIKPLMTSGFPVKLFTREDAEALFQLPPASLGVNGSTYSTTFVGSVLNAGFFFEATSDIVSLLAENADDLRNSWVTSTGTGWKVTKYPVGVEPNFPEPGDSYYQTALRSSEMYLIAAEAYANLGMEDSARYYLDAIRMRAIASANPSTVTGQLLLDAIHNERRKELCFEGFRMFDLLRWKQGVNRLDATTPEAATLPYPSDHAIAPIPLLDVELASLEQNAGY